MLGYFAGGVAGEEHPVVTGHLGRPDLIDLKHFGAAAATSGGVELYHIPGITPEAPTLEAAFGPPRLPEPAGYGPAQRQAVYDDPQLPGHQPRRRLRAARLPARLGGPGPPGGRRAGRATASPGTELWLMLPRALKDVADRSGYTAVIERAGGRLLGDSCPAMSRAAPAGHPGVRHRLGQAGALPARHPRHRGLVRHAGGLRRRRRHRPLAWSALRVITLHGRTVVPGVRRGRGPGLARAHLRLGRNRPGRGADHRAEACS